MRVGYHVKKGKSLLAEMRRAVITLEEFGFVPYLQIFVCGPMNHVMHVLDDEIDGVRGIKHIVHSAYVSHPWNNARGTIHNLGLEFEMAARLGSDGVIVHMGDGIFNDTILANVQKHIHGETRLWLEIAACKPTSPNAFGSPARINKALSLTGAGLVIDTAHLWSLGVSFMGYDETMVWLNKLKCDDVIFHLNDSLDVLGGGRDTHAPCGKGNIWGKFCKKSKIYSCSNLAESGLIACLEWAKKHDAPIILERNDIREELAFLASLCV